jgi:hypothetical protein
MRSEAEVQELLEDRAGVNAELVRHGEGKRLYRWIDRRTGKPVDQAVPELLLLGSMIVAFLLTAIYFALSWLELALG